VALALRLRRVSCWPLGQAISTLSAWAAFPKPKGESGFALRAVARAGADHLPARAVGGLNLHDRADAVAVLYPLFDTLKTWSFGKRFVWIGSVYLVFSFWSAAGAAPGTIEGMVYMRPPFTGLVHLKVQPEIIAQGLALAFLISGAMMEPPRKVEG
jgi:hypothetical protein